MSARIVLAALVATVSVVAPARASASCALCLYGPDNMVFDRAGNLYLVDTDHKTRSRILKLSPDGSILAQWHIFTAGSGGRSGPEGIAIAPDGQFFVTDAGSGHVLRVTSNGRVIGSVGGPKTTFEDLGHVAVDRSGDVFVAESAPNLIQKFSPQGTRIAAWQRARGAGRSEWGGPEAIATEKDGSLVVEDWRNRRIDILSPRGTLAMQFGGVGNGPGKFLNTSGLFVNRNGDIYVADYGLRRVAKFDSRGRWLATTGNSRGHTIFREGPGAIAVDAQGNLYAPDGLGLVKFSQDGRVLARWQ